MCATSRLIFCAILIYCVAGVIRSQAIDDENQIKDSASIEVPVEDTDEDAESSTDQRFRPVVGGVDDRRPEIEQYCWEVDPPHDMPNLSSPLECARTCNDDEKPKTCYYRFETEMYYTLTRACDSCNVNNTNTFCNNCQCVSGDGVERVIMTVNRMLPGPSIDVCEGDKIVVDVVNSMGGVGLTIHWHGLFQRNTQYYDGPAQITQCPITAASTFRYQFYANNPGTHFWHSHDGLQKMDGVFGAIVIRQSQKRDVNSYLYDYDLSHHTVMVSDWMHELASTRVPGRLRDTQFQDPNSFLINGKGQYQDPKTGNMTNREIFHVERNSRYRFRMINAFCTTCSSILTVEDHNLTVIAVDGISIEPTVVTSIISVAGERYDFVINANHHVDSYWIHLRAVAACKSKGFQQLAVLQYEGAPNTPSTPAPTFDNRFPEGIVLNPLDGECDHPRPNAICISNLKSAVEIDRDIVKETPDAKFYLPFKFHRYNVEDLFAPNNFEPFMVAPGFSHSASTVDDISFRAPPSPLLSQPDDIPSDIICNSTHKPDYCVDGELCSCTHIIELPLNGIVELVIIDATGAPNLYHPFHLHGYAFNVISMGSLNNGTGATVDEIKRMDEEGRLSRRTDSVVVHKDTISIPNKGYAIVRFRADNPGYWLFHCHFIYHLSLGMGNVFRVGGPQDLPPVPQGFPTCSNHIPSISPY